ncbi:MAG: DUF1816 domain-containing protein, partial [Pseudanabaenaceae cyanobacterium bins.68]|nr:DUF1816 domain-containing protein [Pseudanabaenaceae cyanobacterium bins.68]
FFISLLERLGLAFWIEISTASPRCIYYFGPYFSRSEAEQAKPGFEEDLVREGATGLVAMIFQRPTPDILTIELENELEEHLDQPTNTPTASTRTPV